MRSLCLSTFEESQSDNQYAESPDKEHTTKAARSELDPGKKTLKLLLKLSCPKRGVVFIMMRKPNQPSNGNKKKGHRLSSFCPFCGGLREKSSWFWATIYKMCSTSPEKTKPLAWLDYSNLKRWKTKAGLARASQSSCTVWGNISLLWRVTGGIVPNLLEQTTQCVLPHWITRTENVSSMAVTLGKSTWFRPAQPDCTTWNTHHLIWPMFIRHTHQF